MIKPLPRARRIIILAVLTLGLISFNAMGQDQAAVVRDLYASVQGDAAVIRVVANAGFQYRRVNAGENKIVVDLMGAIVEKGLTKEVGGGSVVRVRASQNAVDPTPIVRVVVETSGPANAFIGLEHDNILVITIVGSGGGPPPPLTETPDRDPIGAAMKFPVIDLHCDTVTKLYQARDVGLFKGGGLEVTMPRLKAGGVTAQFFAVWIPTDKRSEAFSYANRLMDAFDWMIEANAGDLALATSEGDYRRNKGEGKVSAFLAIEGGEAIGEDIKNLDHFHARGVRYVTLTWNHHNAIADAARDKNKSHGGLSGFGEEVVRRMNELGVIVDVSHASDETVRDCLRLSSDPIIASHSCAYSLRNHYRNLKDDLIAGVCSKGGVIGVNYYDSFLTAGGAAAVADVANHIDHIVKLGGLGCAAIGSDYDGGIRPPRGLENASMHQNLAAELIRRGYSEKDVGLILEGNAARLIEKVVDR